MKKYILLCLCVIFATSVHSSDTYTVKRGGKGFNVPAPLGYILVGVGGSSWALTSTNCTFDTVPDPPTLTCGPSSAYSTIQDEGSDLTVRTKLNFIGATITCADDAGNGRTNCTVTTATNALLDGSAHTDTTNSAVTQGDIIIGNSTPAWDDLAIGTVGQVLTVNAAGTLPEWQTPGVGNPEGPPWGSAVRKYIFLTFAQTSAHTTYNIRGSSEFNGVRNSGAGTLSTAPLDRSYLYLNNSTTAGTVSNLNIFNVQSANNFVQWSYRPVIHYNFAVIDSAGTDSTSNYVTGVAICRSSNAGPLPFKQMTNPAMNCNNGTSTITNGGAGVPGCLMLCWNKTSQANIQKCSNTESVGAGNSTNNCRDSGVAVPAAGTAIDVVFDVKDPANMYIWLNGVQGSALAANLPTVDGSNSVQAITGFQSPNATTDLELILYSFEGWFD